MIRLLRRHRPSLTHTPRPSSFTMYEPRPIRRHSLEPIDLVVVIVGGALIMFGIHPAFELIAWLGNLIGGM